MNATTPSNFGQNLAKSVLIGVMATYLMDLLNQIVALTQLISPSQPAQVGRIFSNWIHADFVVSNPSDLVAYPYEYFMGLLGHYLIGCILAMAYLVGSEKFLGQVKGGLWAVSYGVATSVDWIRLFRDEFSGAHAHLPLQRLQPRLLWNRNRRVAFPPRLGKWSAIGSGQFPGQIVSFPKNGG